jgi:hypothetical protein
MVSGKKPLSTHQKSFHVLVFTNSARPKTFSISPAKLRYALSAICIVSAILCAASGYAVYSQDKIFKLQAQVKELKAGVLATHFVAVKNSQKSEASPSETSEISAVAKNISDTSNDSPRDFTQKPQSEQLKHLGNQLNLEVASTEPLPKVSLNAKVPDSIPTVQKAQPFKELTIPFLTQDVTIAGDDSQSVVSVRLVRSQAGQGLKRMTGSVCLNVLNADGETENCVQKKSVSYAVSRFASFKLNKPFDEVAGASFVFYPSKVVQGVPKQSHAENWILENEEDFK